MEHHFVLRVISKMLIPPIMLYALYVQFHGDFGPGGGFQAGVIFAVAFILYAIVYGVERLTHVVPLSVLRVVMALGVLLFAGTGVYGFVGGYNYLDYAALAEPDQGIAAQHLGILLIEAGVGLTVAGAMIAIFVAFASRSPDIKDTDW